MLDSCQNALGTAAKHAHADTDQERNLVHGLCKNGRTVQCPYPRSFSYSGEEGHEDYFLDYDTDDDDDDDDGDDDDETGASDSGGTASTSDEERRSEENERR